MNAQTRKAHPGQIPIIYSIILLFDLSCIQLNAVLAHTHTGTHSCVHSDTYTQIISMQLLSLLLYRQRKKGRPGQLHGSSSINMILCVVSSLHSFHHSSSQWTNPGVMICTFYMYHSSSSSCTVFSSLKQQNLLSRDMHFK